MKKGISKHFQKLEKGDRITVSIDRSTNFSFPEKLHGKTGIVEGKRGRAYVVKIKEFKKAKQYIIKPTHLEKIK